jgi:hypothetical protein
VLSGRSRIASRDGAASVSSRNAAIAMWNRQPPPQSCPADGEPAGRPRADLLRHLPPRYRSPLLIADANDCSPAAALRTVIDEAIDATRTEHPEAASLHQPLEHAHAFDPTHMGWVEARR